MQLFGLRQLTPVSPANVCALFVYGAQVLSIRATAFQQLIYLRGNWRRCIAHCSHHQRRLSTAVQCVLDEVVDVQDHIYRMALTSWVCPYSFVVGPHYTT
jgi:hypothetical protein